MEKRKGKSILRIVICTLLALALVIGVAAFIIVDDFLALINRVGENENTLSSEELEIILGQTEIAGDDFTGPSIDPDDIILPEVSVDPIGNNENIINILLVGQDRREGQARMHSDSIIMCTINKSDKTLTMTSFLRDVWVRIPERYDERINVPYMVGGFPLLNSTLEYNFGISADYNIEVDFFGFQKAIDAVGGVDIDLTAAEAGVLNAPSSWDLGSAGRREVTAGVNRLNGAQALVYSRIRKIDNDFGRTNRQRTVLTALFNRVKELSATEIYRLAQEILPSLTTDMTNAQILGCILEIAPLLSELEIVSQRIPVDNNYSFASIQGKSVIVLGESDKAKALQLIEDTMGK